MTCIDFNLKLNFSLPLEAMQAMHEGKFIFSQLMDFVRGDACKPASIVIGRLQTSNLPLCGTVRVMAFAQLTYRHSLREVETCLRAVQAKLYHLASAVRSHTATWRMPITRAIGGLRRFAQILIQRAKQLYLGDDLGSNSTPRCTPWTPPPSTFALVFPWAKFRKAKGAVKLHTLLNLQGDIPEFILISTENCTMSTCWTI